MAAQTARSIPAASLLSRLYCPGQAAHISVTKQYTCAKAAREALNCAGNLFTPQPSPNSILLNVGSAITSKDYFSPAGTDNICACYLPQFRQSRVKLTWDFFTYEPALPYLLRTMCPLRHFSSGEIETKVLRDNTSMFRLV